MKIAVSVNGRDLDAPVDPRFGRASCFLFVDPETMRFEVVENSKNLGASQGAGIQAAATVAREGATVVLTGYCGPKAFQTLRSAGIQVVVGAGGSAREAVRKFLEGSLQRAQGPNVQGHWAQ
ncbi:MAG: dinitrogenase iron-molybdenum cofactor biosynthesis protein [Syntrophobacteraceae bacterium]|nr:dinitrogenase iron-molybdenum cofactor biosynthesis protein [Syntrophobacteraceae bacterium]